MTRIRRLLKIFLIGFTALVASAILFYFVSWYAFWKERTDAVFGVTFSTIMARQLGLDPQKVFDAILTDLRPKKIRLPVYWGDIEPERGALRFDEYDYFLRRAEESGIKMLLAVGRKLPRWPECHMPFWVYQLSAEDQQKAVEQMIQRVVKRYQGSPAVAGWQVENEPFFRFGAGCAEAHLDAEDLRQEVAVVRAHSDKPVMVTDSGEQGLWLPTAKFGDGLGITMYRQTWNERLGVTRFPLGPGFYRMKQWLFNLFSDDKKIIVAELQAEPWGPGKLLPEYDIKIQKDLMSAEQFRKNISYARRTGFETFYLWGVEWWYWLNEKKSDASLWDEAKKLKNIE